MFIYIYFFINIIISISNFKLNNNYVKNKNKALENNNKRSFTSSKYVNEFIFYLIFIIFLLIIMHCTNILYVKIGAVVAEWIKLMASVKIYLQTQVRFLLTTI